MISNHGIKLDALLDSMAGSYLKTVRYQSRNGLVCPYCGGFKSAAFSSCRSCSLVASDARNVSMTGLLADRIAMGVYAIEPESQTLKMMYDYKEPYTPASYTNTVRAILALAVDGHRECLDEVSGLALTGWAVVPSSTSSRRHGKPHPLQAIVRQVLPDVPEIRLLSHKDKYHRFDPDAFTLVSEQDRGCLSGNVLLIDDSWVTGGNAQSAAACLKRNGAMQVSVYCVSRIVSLDFLRQVGSNEDMTSFNTGVAYMKGYCPWHRCDEGGLMR